jgi:hypothetical protein
MFKIDLKKLESLFGQMDIQGIPYGLGAKADIKDHWNPRSRGTLDTPVEDIDHIDCSGFIRYLIYHCSDTRYKLPDGSQNQLKWCEDNNLHVVNNYSDANAYMNDHRLFISFIKPFNNGCGPVGHVWLASQIDKDISADTMESHSPNGVSSRPWNYRTLYKQVYKTFELNCI